MNFSCANSSGATLEEVEMADRFAFWTEGVVQGTLAVLGVVGNTVAILILLSKRRHNSVFSSILGCLLILQSLYVMTSMVFMARIWRPSYLLDLMFAKGLYLLKPLLLHASSFLTVMLARERNTAVRYPMTYRCNTSHIGPAKVVLTYLVPALLLSLCVVAPMQFELAFIYDEKLNATNNLVYDTIQPRLTITDLRTNYYYVLLYKNLATFALTILVPFLLLLQWNCNTYRVIANRRRSGRLIRSQVGRRKIMSEEEDAKILFAIVIMFVSCNFLRYVLSLEECFAIRSYQAAVESSCNPVPIWALLANSVSQLLLALNAVMGMFVYCLMSASFKGDLARSVRKVCGCCSNESKVDEVV